MWTRRLLLATMVAAAALSLPRHLHSSGGSQHAANTLAASAFR